MKTAGEFCVSSCCLARLGSVSVFVLCCVCVQHSGQFLCALMDLGGRDEHGRGICWSGKRAGIKYRLSRVHPVLTASPCAESTPLLQLGRSGRRAEHNSVVLLYLEQNVLK